MQRAYERDAAAASAEFGAEFALPKYCPGGIGPNYLNPDDDPLIAQAIEVQSRAQAATEHMLEAAKAIHTDPTKTQAAQHIAAREYAVRTAPQITKPLDAVIQRVKAEVVRLEKLLQGPPSPSDARALPICLGLLQMSQTERRKVILDCLAEGDEAAIATVLNASRIATGLSAIELAELRTQWRAIKYPAEARRLQQLQHVDKQLDIAGRAFSGFPHRLYARAIIDEVERKVAMTNTLLKQAV